MLQLIYKEIVFKYHGIKCCDNKTSNKELYFKKVKYTILCD